jgi:hypothetical protein
MTRLVKKQRERFLVEEVARCLGTVWDLGPDREHPDFMVTEGNQRSGLEVCEIFTGAQSVRGAAMKARESNTQHKVDALRHAYEAAENIPLTVKFVGNMIDETLALVVSELLTRALSSKPVGHREVLDWGNGLRVRITKGLRQDWYSVNDRVGWVDRDAAPRIFDAIAKKAQELSRYRQSAGADVRLLIVADRLRNSGKLLLEQRVSLNLDGFRVVYFYSRPESVVIFGETDAAA